MIKPFFSLFNRVLGSRFWALAQKEIRQILRNKQLLFLLIFPPTLQLLLYGFALNPDVHYLKLGVVDYAQTLTSRELVSALTENRVFTVNSVLFNEQQLAEQVETGQLNVGMVIPPHFSRDLNGDEPAEIQVFIDGVDANTAGIANGYISQMIQQFNLKEFAPQNPPPINTQVTFLYNPGLISSWFLSQE